MGRRGGGGGTDSQEIAPTSNIQPEECALGPGGWMGWPLGGWVEGREPDRQTWPRAILLLCPLPLSLGHRIPAKGSPYRLQRLNRSRTHPLTGLTCPSSSASSIGPRRPRVVAKSVKCEKMKEKRERERENGNGTAAPILGERVGGG